MEVKIKNFPDSRIEMEIEISPQEFEKFEEQALKKINENAEIKGFRKGTAPKEVVEKELGKEKILVQTADLAVKESYKKAIDENKIEPIQQPEVEILKIAQGSPFVFKVKTSVLPEIKLPDYKKISKSCSKKEIKVGDKEIKESLEWIRRSRAKFSLKQGPAQKNDFVEIEYSSPQIKGFGENSFQKDAFILGEGKLVPGFEEQLVGIKTGEEKTFSIAIPEKYPQQELAGKKVDFAVKIVSLQKVELPEFTDEFVRGLGDFKDLNDLKEKIKEGIFLEKKEEETRRLREEILSKVAEKTSCEVPVVLVEEEKLRLMDSFKKKTKDILKIPFEDYLAKIKKSEKEISDSFSGQALANVKKFLVLKEMGKKENINVSQEEIEKELNNFLKNHKNIEAVKDIDLKKLQEYTKEAMATEKIFFLLESFLRN